MATSSCCRRATRRSASSWSVITGSDAIIGQALYFSRQAARTLQQGLTMSGIEPLILQLSRSPGVAGCALVDADTGMV